LSIPSGDISSKEVYPALDASTLIGIRVEHEELNGACSPLMADAAFVDDKQLLCSLVFPRESPHQRCGIADRSHAF
jgi:hypothetical protein